MSLAEMNYTGGKRKDRELLWGQVRSDTRRWRCPHKGRIHRHGGQDNGLGDRWRFGTCLMAVTRRRRKEPWALKM